MNPEPGISYMSLIDFLKQKAQASTELSPELRGVYLALAVEFACIREAVMARARPGVDEPEAKGS